VARRQQLAADRQGPRGGLLRPGDVVPPPSCPADRLPGAGRLHRLRTQDGLVDFQGLQSHALGLGVLLLVIQPGRLLLLPQRGLYLGPVRRLQARDFLDESGCQASIGRPPVVLPVHALADGQGLFAPSYRPAPVALKLVQLGQPGECLGHHRGQLAPGSALQLQEPLGDMCRLVELAGLAQLLDLLRQAISFRERLQRSR
jgi:hypothetical protein